MYIFKYHPDGHIYRNGTYYKDFNSFKLIHSSVPIVQGQFFEYRNDGLDLINSQGHHTAANPDDYEDLIIAIDNMG